MSQDYYGRNSRFTSSWNVINNDLYDDDDYRYNPSYATETWSVLDSQDVREDQLSSSPQNNNNGFNYGSSTVSTIQEERNSTQPIPEPEFAPSISSSTKGFIETTFKYEKQGVFGRSNEYNEFEDDDDYCPLPSDSDIQSFDNNSQSIVSNIVPNNSSWDFVRQYSFAGIILVFGLIIYYIKDFPFVEFYNSF
ncbi:hypothetical protein RclHR1_05860006 [Rhizophagus clarus]|uniref:Uncharacterized protein n=1 Tax=Rhizophagus clarus TaxID=94130 RepID=A0A2Z6RP02_9GLOM|nr:hypothetical protein RclHR1_05860006 [Rhizophagus clarus]GES74162.1 hypothetical protein GLOIN_2v1476851 [Rhizophagus clarus]